MENLKNQANQVANAGRFGDSMLVHMNPIEVQGLANTMPMTVNPQTGQPEMFLPFLAPLLGGAAGTALFSGIMSPAVAGAVGSGLATAIAEGDLKKGIMAGITGFGIGNVLGQIGSGAQSASEQAIQEAITEAAADAGSAAAINPVVTQAVADQAGQQAATDAMARFTGNVTEDAVAQTLGENIAGQAGVGGLPLGATGGSSVGPMDRLGMIGENLFSQDTLSALSQPSSYLPIAIGEGQRGAIEAQEQFEEDMRQFEQDQEDRKRRLYAMNPEQIPFGSPFYGAAEGGVMPFQKGGLATIPVGGLPRPVFPEETVTRMPVQPMPNASSFESAMQGELDYMYMTPPTAPSRSAPAGEEIMQENVITREMQGTGQFAPPSSYRPGIDAEFNYFPFSNRPASVIPGNYSMGGMNPFYSFLSGNNPTYQNNPNFYQNLMNQVDSALDMDNLTPEQRRQQSRLRRAGASEEEINNSLIDMGITSQAKADTFNVLQDAYYNNPYLSNPYLINQQTLPEQREDLLEASADFLEDMKGKGAMETGGGRMASGRKIDDVTRGMAIHEMEEGKTIPEDAKGLQALAKEKPDVVRSMGYEIDMQVGGPTIMPEDLDMVQKAILGQIPNNQEVISMFIDKYGNELFMQIREQVLNPMGSMQTQGMIEGMGGGMDDQVMGMIGTQQPVAVSPGEYIIPADVVSGLGDGSSDAGAKELDGMLDRVRQERTNTTKQPKELNKGRVLPA